MQERGSKWDLSRRGSAGDNYNKYPNKKNKTTPENLSYKERKEDTSATKRPLDQKEILKTSNPYARPTTGKCFRCRQTGHRSNECPNRRALTS